MPDHHPDVLQEIRSIFVVSSLPDHVCLHPKDWQALPGSDRTKRLRKKRWTALMRLLGYR